MSSRRRPPRGLAAIPAVVTCAFVVSCALALAACTTGTAAAGNATPNARRPGRTATATPAPAPSPSPSATPLAPMPVAPGNGRLHQTTARPRARGPAFRAMVADLWLAVRTGKASLGKYAFFPVSSYKQVKAIWDPAGDWRYRLWLDFSLDVKAAHKLLGRHPRQARLVRVIVPSSQAAWVGVGACYNKAGYWHVAGSRVVYRVHGKEHSFGIASMISWRGIWYVIHFGGVTRPAVGMVDAPAVGPGYPGPPGGC